MLVRKSDAVCALPDGKGYICDAVNARHPLGNSAVGDSIEPVAPTAPAVRLPILIGGESAGGPRDESAEGRPKLGRGEQD